MRMMIALILFTVVNGCALEETSEDGQVQELGDAPSAVWLVCEHANLTGLCLSGPVREPSLDYPFNNNISSIQTNGTAMETWNDPNFKGTYGYFAPWGTWSTLSSPYNDAISSISYPGA